MKEFPKTMYKGSDAVSVGTGEDDAADRAAQEALEADGWSETPEAEHWNANGGKDKAVKTKVHAAAAEAIAKADKKAHALKGAPKGSQDSIKKARAKSKAKVNRQ